MSKESNVRAVSTTWRLKVEKITGAPQASRTAARKGHRWRRFGPRNPSEWITIRVKYMGGGSGWVIVQGRGETNPYPADTWLLNLVFDINQCH